MIAALCASHPHLVLAFNWTLAAALIALVGYALAIHEPEE